LIPVPQAQGGGFVKDESGAFVRSRLDESALKAIAAATGGFYAPLGTQGEGLEAIFSAVLGSTAKHDLASRRQRIYIERYQWPLAGSLAMLLASLVIGTRRRHGAQAAAASRAVAAAGLILMMSARVQPAQAADPNASGGSGSNGAPAIDSKLPQRTEPVSSRKPRNPSSNLSATHRQAI